MTTSVTVQVPKTASYKAVVTITEPIGETTVTRGGVSITEENTFMSLVKPGERIVYNIWARKEISVYEAPLDQQVLDPNGVPIT